MDVSDDDGERCRTVALEALQTRSEEMLLAIELLREEYPFDEEFLASMPLQVPSDCKV